MPVVFGAVAAHPLTPPPGMWSSSELISTMTEHVVVFEVSYGPRNAWWVWCFVDLNGAGFSRRRWTRPGGQVDGVTPIEPEGEAAGWRYLFDYDTPIVAD